ncbi:hypothetical protein PY365_03065 [Roseiarcaceae bacterium H3SJ34-1]|uniref:hypothetical protein n=1 Tax=Terripilifer ovatus TaxID=3032367 RepID=UPI003AB9BB2E|nr:hypothetical protein [Roseiarcaceae bacterium H3SJ34-1]
MSKLWKAASVVAALSIITAAAIQLNATSAFSQATPGRVGLQPVPPNCYDSRIQVPTRGGPEWKQLIMCPSE